MPSSHRHTSTAAPKIHPIPSSSSHSMTSTMIDEELDARLGPRTSHPCAPCERKEGATAAADGGEPIWVEWDGPDDPQNPLNWSKRRKWVVTTLGLMYTSIVSVAVTSYSISEGSVARELNVKPILATLGVTCFTIAFGTVPLILAPLSELFGRRLIYFASGFGFIVFYLPIALAPNIGAVLASRFLIGAVGSCSISLVGGSIADVWAGAERGLPLAWFSWAAFAFTGLGASMYSYAEARYGFRMISWCMMATAGVQFILLILFVPETRASVLLARKAAALRKETGDPRYQSKEVALRGSFLSMLGANLTRPVKVLTTEPVVVFFTLWISMGWGVLYLLLGSIVIVFQDQYGFATGPLGFVYASQAVGACLGLAVDMYICAPLYHKNVAKRGPEARLYTAMIGGAVFPLGIWIYTFTSYPNVHWMGPIVGLTILYGGLYLIYLAVFNYLADSYTLYSSSVLAAMSMVRNIVGAVFPLFTAAMYNRLGIQGAGGLVAGLATALGATPVVLFVYGERARARSPFAKQLAKAEAEREAEMALAKAKEIEGV